MSHWDLKHWALRDMGHLHCNGYVINNWAQLSVPVEGQPQMEHQTEGVWWGLVGTKVLRLHCCQTALSRMSLVL
jgi:hypothetical protein